MLQKMRRRRNQKKTAMTPVPTRIASSMLPLSSEPECAEGGKCVCVGRVHLWEAPLPVGTICATCGRKVGGGARRGDPTFHGHAGGGIDAALGVAYAAQIAARVLLAHALDAQLLVRVRQVNSCRGRGGGSGSGGSGP